MNLPAFFSPLRTPATATIALPLTTSQLALALAVLTGAASGSLVTDATATAHAVAASGIDFTRLLRAMAMIKCVMAAAAATVVFWRLATRASSPWLCSYLAACFAMAAGPGLIWSMVHVGAGALLLHGGLLATIILVWRDPATATRLAGMVARRRVALRK